MLLAIETGYGACSVAMIAGARVLASRHELIGRGHAERLVPLVGEVIAEVGAIPGAIAVDVGPGSFTGLRVGIAAGRALSLVWRVPASGFSSMTLVAATAFEAAPDIASVVVVMDAGRGEVYLQAFNRQLEWTGEPVAVVPASIDGMDIEALAGTGAGMLATSVASQRIISTAPPNAADARLLSPALRSLSLRPIYVRAPDAKLPVT